MNMRAVYQSVTDLREAIQVDTVLVSLENEDASVLCKYLQSVVEELTMGPMKHPRKLLETHPALYYLYVVYTGVFGSPFLELLAPTLWGNGHISTSIVHGILFFARDMQSARELAVCDFSEGSPSIVNEQMPAEEQKMIEKIQLYLSGGRRGPQKEKRDLVYDELINLFRSVGNIVICMQMDKGGYEKASSAWKEPHDSFNKLCKSVPANEKAVYEYAKGLVAEYKSVHPFWNTELNLIQFY